MGGPPGQGEGVKGEGGRRETPPLGEEVTGGAKMDADVQYGAAPNAEGRPGSAAAD
eukprot:gene19964-57804_t